jgi:hypothetical protein
MRISKQAVILGLCLASPFAFAADFSPKPIPRLQALPLPHHQISFVRDDVELTRFHFDPADRRPFLYPVIGPAGRTLTRMGHPHDPFTHSHHNSLWLAHHDVNGVSFWDDRSGGEVRCVRVEHLHDSDSIASATVLNSWTSTNQVLLWERRKMTVLSLASNEWMLLLDVRFDSAKAPVTFGKTPFGLAAVRMAKSIGVHDGAGVIRNSEGAVNEVEVFRKPAKWVDYSGAVATGIAEGITFFDHPQNPNFPSAFHVRNDGWMGAALTFTNEITVDESRPLHLRYGFYVHRGMPDLNALHARWTDFSQMTRTNLLKAKP